MKSEVALEGLIKRVRGYITRGIFPGCEFVLIDGDKIQKFLFGNAAILPEPQLLEAGRRWDLASVSKVVGVGTLIINRFLDARLDLEAPLRYYYSDWHEETVTLHQLLTHSSGINPYIEGRDKLNFEGLVTAINQLPVDEDKIFHYTDINFILLGFMLEKLENRSLDALMQEEIFQPWQMKETGYGPAKNAVPTDYRLVSGLVHDPKARVLGKHCGSAGLFSSLEDMIHFSQAYLSQAKYLKLMHNFSDDKAKARSLAWDLLSTTSGDWLLHTGYTGTFILLNLQAKKSVIFLSNRVHLTDERKKWISDRNLLIQDFMRLYD